MASATLGAWQRSAARLLCDQARAFYARDWMLGTSGNLSIKVQDNPLTIAVTASGRDKGRLTPADVVLVNRRCELITTSRTRRAAAKPSAETTIHLTLYEQLPDCGAVFHVHTLYSTVLTSRVPHGAGLHHFRVQRLEMLKGFNLWAQDASADLPVFANWADVKRVAADVRQYYAKPRAVPALLLAHHGLTAWGRNAAEAAKHLEIAEFICSYLWTTGARPVPAARPLRARPVVII